MRRQNSKGNGLLRAEYYWRAALCSHSRLLELKYILLNSFLSCMVSSQWAYIQYTVSALMSSEVEFMFSPF